jgi:hypothetical protein
MSAKRISARAAMLATLDALIEQGREPCSPEELEAAMRAAIDALCAWDCPSAAVKERRLLEMS